MNNADIDNSAFEAKQIVLKAMNFSGTDFLLHRDDAVNEENVAKIHNMCNDRISGIPIQYVLGEWDFMGYTFHVGEGVLIPRPETEILCQYVIDKVKDKPESVVIDLCSGSGCIGISVALNVESARVILVEKSDEALYYLKQNAEKFNLDNVTVLKGDIFDTDSLLSSLPEADVIVSNPPYIKSDEIPSLQSEVLKEPEMALDGGKDGLDFYRCICKEWTRLLKQNGETVLECGENQAQDIGELFKNESFNYKIIKDYNGIDRIVIGGRFDYGT